MEGVEGDGWMFLGVGWNDRLLDWSGGGLYLEGGVGQNEKVV